MTGYIYEIVNLVNNKKYIGQTINPINREKQHFTSLQNNKHWNKHLQRSFNKYGEENFDFFIIDSTNNLNELDELESYYIVEIGGFPDTQLCYNNITDSCGSSRTFEAYTHQKDICDMYIKEKSALKVYNKYHCGVGVIYHILELNNIERINGRDDLNEDKICQEYINGTSSLVLKNKYNCAKGTILKILYDNNIDVRDGSDTQFKKGNIPYNIRLDVLEHEDEICNLYYFNIFNISQLSAKYNCGAGIIRKILKNNNIKITSTKGKIPYNKSQGKIDKIGGFSYIYQKLQKETASQISRNLNIRRQGVSEWIREHGVSTIEAKTLNFAQTSFIDFPKKACLCLSTGSCLMNCPYCFNKELKNKHYLSADVANFAIDKKLKYITAISVTGAEPLLNPELNEILKYAKDKGLKTKIDTSLKTDIVIDKNIFQHLDYMNISIKNLEHLQYIDYIINWIIENYDTYLEFNLVYHPQYISNTELKQINEIIKKYDVPLVLVQMDIDFMNSINDKVSKEELIHAANFFDNKEIYLLTKEFGREKI